MSLNDFLIEAHKALDAATVEDGLGNTALCMWHLGKLHGLVLVFQENIETSEPRKCRNCGCTDLNACPGPCYWVEVDLCSTCAPAGTPAKTSGSTGIMHFVPVSD